jgi:hypothetical protein
MDAAESNAKFLKRFVRNNLCIEFILVCNFSVSSSLPSTSDADALLRSVYAHVKSTEERKGLDLSVKELVIDANVDLEQVWQQVCLFFVNINTLVLQIETQNRGALRRLHRGIKESQTSCDNDLLVKTSSVGDNDDEEHIESDEEIDECVSIFTIFNCLY